MLEKRKIKRRDIVKIKYWNLEGIVMRTLNNCCVVRCNDGIVRDINIFSLEVLDEKKEIKNGKEKMGKNRKSKIK